MFHCLYVCVYLAFSLSLPPPNSASSVLVNAGLLHWKEKLVGFGSDGAVLMIEKKTGVTAQLVAEIPYVLDIHCLAHKLKLGGLDALKANLQINYVKEIFNGIYKTNYYSPKAWRDLETVA